MLKVNYAKSIYDVKETYTPNKNTQMIELRLESYVRDAQVRYTLDYSKPTANSPLFIGSQTFNKLVTIRAITFRNGQELGKEFNKMYGMPEK